MTQAAVISSAYYNWNKTGTFLSAPVDYENLFRCVQVQTHRIGFTQQLWRRKNPRRLGEPVIDQVEFFDLPIGEEVKHSQGTNRTQDWVNFFRVFSKCLKFREQNDFLSPSILVICILDCVYFIHNFTKGDTCTQDNSSKILRVSCENRSFQI